jgi:hypothetical protein
VMSAEGFNPLYADRVVESPGVTNVTERAFGSG